MKQPPDNEKRGRRAGAPTIEDVAALADVSWRTVSNVIYGHKYLHPRPRTAWRPPSPNWVITAVGGPTVAQRAQQPADPGSLR
jgi:hypothetical protein